MVKAGKTGFDGVFRVGGRLATVNLVPGFRSSNEELASLDGVEYRLWDHFTSKPAAALKKGLEIFPLKGGMNVLYLGLAEGKTASFFSDIVGKEGLVYGVEISERSLREAIPVCERRGNIVPILSDARRPELYESVIMDRVDCVFEDVASPDQIQILIRNCKKFLRPGGYAMIAIKSQSIDVVKPPRQVYRECLEEIGRQFGILDKVELDPFEKCHLFIVLKLSDSW